MARRRRKSKASQSTEATATPDSGANKQHPAMSNIPGKEASKIRKATFADLSELIAMGKELHKENGIRNSSDELIAKTALSGIESGQATLAVIGDPGNLEAMIYLTISRFYYTHDLHLEELFAYVRPEFRGSGHARALLDFAKTSATRLGIPLLVGVVSNKRTQSKIALYERILGKPAGAYFLYNGKTGAE